MKLYDVKAIARVLNLSERRVRQLKDEKIITEYNGRPGLYALIPTIHAYINYKCNGNSENGERADYNAERTQLIKARRQLAETELAVRAGELHSAADIEKVMTDMLINFKARLMAIPAKLSPTLSKKTDKAEIYRILKDSVDEALCELATFDKIFKTGEES